MAMELVGIETCYRHEEKIPPRFKPCPYAAAAAATVVAAKITTPFRHVPAIAAVAMSVPLPFTKFRPTNPRADLLGYIIYK